MPKTKEYKITFSFKSQFDKEYFLSQIGDGLGENFCYMDWPEDEDLFETKIVSISLLEDEYYARSVLKKYKRSMINRKTDKCKCLPCCGFCSEPQCCNYKICRKCHAPKIKNS